MNSIVQNVTARIGKETGLSNRATRLSRRTKDTAEVVVESLTEGLTEGLYTLAKTGEFVVNVFAFATVGLIDSLSTACCPGLERC